MPTTIPSTANTSWRRGMDAYHHYKIFKPGDETAWMRAVESPPVSDQLQAMVLQVQTGAAERPGADEQNRRRAGQRRGRHVEFQCRRCWKRGRCSRISPCSARNCASRAGWGSGCSAPTAHNRRVSVVADVDTNLTAAVLDAGPSGRHHQQSQRAGPGQHEHAGRRFKNGGRRRRFCSGIEAALAACAPRSRRKMRKKPTRRHRIYFRRDSVNRFFS